MARFALVGCLSSLFVLTWMRAAVDPSSRQISYSHVMKMVRADAVMEIVWATDLSVLLFVLRLFFRLHSEGQLVLCCRKIAVLR
jgi:hypothetical protein